MVFTIKKKIIKEERGEAGWVRVTYMDKGKKKKTWLSQGEMDSLRD